MNDPFFEMESNKPVDFTNSLQQVVELFHYLRRRWIRILLVVFVGAVVGYLVARFTPIKYTSKLSFILEEGKASGGISAIAGQFGLDIGSGSGSSNLLSGENIVGLLKSQRFTREVLLSSYETGSYSLADRYADIYKLRKRWKENKKIKADIYFPAGINELSRLQDSLLQTIEFQILTEELSVERPDKKMSFFNVGLISKDELFAKYFTERLLKDVIDFYVETKTRRLRANVNRLQFRSDSIAALLNNRTYAAAVAQSSALDINPAYQSASVPAEVSNRNKAMIGTIYAEIVKNLEIQKITLNQETPVIQVVDEIQLPLKIKKASKLLYMFGGAFIAGFLMIIALLFLKYTKGKFSKTNKEIKPS